MHEAMASSLDLQKLSSRLLICFAPMLFLSIGVNVKQAATMRFEFCTACAMKHGSPRFWGRTGFKVCSKVYQKRCRATRAAEVSEKRSASQKSGRSSASNPPIQACLKGAQQIIPRSLNTAGWRTLLGHVGDTDHTGSRLVNAFARTDVQSMNIARRMLMKMGGSYAESQNCIFALAFCFLLYWSWPVISCVTAMCSHGLQGISSYGVRSDTYRIFDFYNDFFVRDGVLV